MSKNVIFSSAVQNTVLHVKHEGKRFRIPFVNGLAKLDAEAGAEEIAALRAYIDAAKKAGSSRVREFDPKQVIEDNKEAIEDADKQFAVQEGLKKAGVNADAASAAAKESVKKTFGAK